MLTAEEKDAARELRQSFSPGAGIAFTRSESMETEVADFGLSRLEETGLQVVPHTWWSAPAAGRSSTNAAASPSSNVVR